MPANCMNTFATLDARIEPSIPILSQTPSTNPQTGRSSEPWIAHQTTNRSIGKLTEHVDARVQGRVSMRHVGNDSRGEASRVPCICKPPESGLRRRHVALDVLPCDFTDRFASSQHTATL